MKLLDEGVLAARRRRLARNTIDVYSGWIRGYLRFCADARGRWTHPSELGAGDVEVL
jgi:hypothetical protein